jgi:hypothetical protein
MAVSVEKVTYARVAQDASPASAKPRPHDAGLDAFLLGHVTALRGFAAGKNSCPATFVEADGQNLFDSLRTGTDSVFLDAAHKITLRLIGQMHGATAPGLLVCMQIKDGATLSAAVLKLQVVTPNAANLETLDSGEVLLSAVTDVMDAPGKLQKGALVEDSRPDSDVIMGDLASKEAQYFPRAFGISIEQRPALAAADVLEIIRELQGDAVEEEARHALRSVPTGPIAQVLEGLGQAVPELQPAEARQAVQDRLASRPRPVRSVDTAAPLVEHITASGVTIKVPITGQNRVTVEPDNVDGGYIIRIRVDEQPRREVR